MCRRFVISKSILEFKNTLMLQQTVLSDKNRELNIGQIGSPFLSALPFLLDSGSHVVSVGLRPNYHYRSCSERRQCSGYRDGSSSARRSTAKAGNNLWRQCRNRSEDCTDD